MIRLLKKKNLKRATYVCWSLVEKVCIQCTYNEQIIYFMTRYTKTRTCYWQTYPWQRAKRQQNDFARYVRLI